MNSFRWRTVDIVVASIIAVAFGVDLLGLGPAVVRAVRRSPSAVFPPAAGARQRGVVHPGGARAADHSQAGRGAVHRDSSRPSSRCCSARAGAGCVVWYGRASGRWAASSPSGRSATSATACTQAMLAGALAGCGGHRPRPRHSLRYGDCSTQLADRLRRLPDRCPAQSSRGWARSPSPGRCRARACSTVSPQRPRSANWCDQAQRLRLAARGPTGLGGARRRPAHRGGRTRAAPGPVRRGQVHPAASDGWAAAARFRRGRGRARRRRQGGHRLPGSAVAAGDEPGRRRGRVRPGEPGVAEGADLAAGRGGARRRSVSATRCDRRTDALSGGEQQRLVLAGVAGPAPGTCCCSTSPRPTSTRPATAAGAASAFRRSRRWCSSSTASSRSSISSPGWWCSRRSGGVWFDGSPSVLSGPLGDQLAAEGVWVPGHPLPHLTAAAEPGETLAATAISPCAEARRWSSPDPTAPASPRSPLHASAACVTPRHGPAAVGTAWGDRPHRWRRQNPCRPHRVGVPEPGAPVRHLDRARRAGAGRHPGRRAWTSCWCGCALTTWPAPTRSPSPAARLEG